MNRIRDGIRVLAIDADKGALSGKPGKRIVPGTAAERLLLGTAMIWAGLWLILDQATKALVVGTFALHESRPVLAGIFSLTYVINRGAAWNILDGYGALLLGIALAVGVLAMIFLRKLTDGWPERYLAIFTILGGVVGNSIDRLWRGGVVDFLDFHFWPVFNVADCAICGGVALYILSGFLRPEPQKNNP